MRRENPFAHSGLLTMIVSQVSTYLKFLSSADAVFSYYWMSDNKPISGYGVCHGDINQIEKEFNEVKAIENYPTLHITLNETNLQGRKTQNIKGVRVLCIDLDKVLPIEEIQNLIKAYNPHLITESSPGKVHLYWKIEGISKEDWKKFQLALAWNFGADLNLASLAHTIRVPGFTRVTKQGMEFTPRIVRTSEHPALDHMGIASLFPFIEDAYAAAELNMKEKRRELRKQAKLVREHKDPAQIELEGRNSALYFACTEHMKLNPGATLQELHSFAEEFNNTFVDRLGDNEVTVVAKKVHAKHLDFEEEKHLAMTGMMDTIDDQPPAILKEPEEKISDTKEIAGDLLDAAKLFARHLGSKEYFGLLDVCFKSKVYAPLASFICKQWRHVGMFKHYPFVCTMSETPWGKSVIAGEFLDKEKFIAFANKVLMYSFHLHKNKKSVPPTQSIRAAAISIWEESLLCPHVARQSADLVVFQNGILDLVTGQFSNDSFAPYKYSNAIWAEYKKDVEGSFESLCPVTFKYFNDWFPDDSGAWEVLLCWIGYCLTTDTRFQTYTFFYGPTGAGKGSIAQIIRGLVGYTNYISIDYAALDGGFKLAEIHNKLVCVIDEVEAHRKEHETRLALLKKLTGNEHMQFERKYQQPIVDTVSAKFMLISNSLLQYSDKGNSLNQRTLAVGFEKSFRGEMVGLPSDEILKSEADNLATICTRLWRKARNNKKPFFRDGCRALEVGKEVTDKMNIVDYVCSNYLIPMKDANLPAKILTRVIELIAELNNADIGKQVDRQLGLAMERIFPKHPPTRFYGQDKVRHRGFMGLAVSVEKLQDTYAELEEPPPALLADFRDVYEYLGVTDLSQQYVV